MFWPKKNSDKNNKNTDKRTEGTGTDRFSVGTTNGQRNQGKTRDDLCAEALANVQAARANIGEDALKRFAFLMQQKQDSPAERARELIRNAPPDSVLYKLRDLIEN